jgi:hypothetical protein
MLIARAAAANGYNILAVSASDKESLCWVLDDLPAINAVLGAFSKQLGVAASAPRFGFGGSSGAAFLSIIAVVVPFDAIAVMPESIAPDWALFVGDFLAAGFDVLPLPPTLILQMPREVPGSGFNPAGKSSIASCGAILLPWCQ